MCGAQGARSSTRTSLSSRSPIALDWSARKAAAPLSLSVLSVIASVSPVRKAPHRLSKRKRGTGAAASSPFAAMAMPDVNEGVENGRARLLYADHDPLKLRNSRPGPGTYCELAVWGDNYHNSRTGWGNAALRIPK